MISDIVVPEHVFREFLMWLLYRSEQENGMFELQGEFVTFRVEDQLKLEGEGDVRQTDLKKGVPSISEEARISMRNGKLPTRMRVRLTIGSDDYLFVLDSVSMEVRQLKTPAVPFREAPMKLDQRLFHLGQVYRILELLMKEFVKERLDDENWAGRTREISEWVHAPAD